MSGRVIGESARRRAAVIRLLIAIVAVVISILLFLFWRGKEGWEREVWVYSTGLSIYYSSAAIGADGTIYFGTSYGSGSPGSGHGLYALNPDGSLRWKCDTPAIRSAPALGSDGTIYFVVESNNRTLAELYALTSDGSLKWTYTIDYSANPQCGLSTPAIASDGTIYVAGDGFFAFNPDGSMKWHYAAGDVWNSPTIGLDGTVYVAIDVTLYAFHPDGTVKWQYNIMMTPRPDGTSALSSPALGIDGTIYFGDEAGIFHAVDPDGNQKWTYDIAQGRVCYIRSSPSIGTDGTIYVGTKVSPGVQVQFVALNPNGTLKWVYEPHDRNVNGEGNDIYSSPAIGSDGTIYFGCETLYVYALTPDGTLNWKFRTSGLLTNARHVGVGIAWPSPAIGSDGTLYIGNMSGDFYAIDTDSEGGLANTPWPKFHKDNYNTGRF